MGVKLVSSSGGSVELVAPTTASNFTATMPANTGTVITTASTFAGTGPSFSAYNNGTQTLTGGVEALVAFPSEEYDTANCFDSASTYRFTPNVAGYYQISAGVFFPNSYNPQLVSLNKNGVKTREFGRQTAGACMISGSSLVYLNGTTDYVTVAAYLPTTNTIGTASGGTAYTWFCGFLARAA